MRALRRLQREQGVAVPFSMVMTHRKRSESMPLYGQSSDRKVAKVGRPSQTGKR